MSTCTAEEIAKKRRYAMEKLQGRKGHLIANINQLSAGHLAETISPRSTSTAGPTAASFYSRNLNPKGPENKASTFLSALSNNKEVMEYIQQNKSKALTRAEAVHPYHKSTNKSHRDGAPKDSAKPAESTKLFLGSTTNCYAYVISPNRFEVDAPNFHQQLVNVFKTLTTKNYGW